jgi:hypothetical protein
LHITRFVFPGGEKAGTATRVKGKRPGIPDTWKPADRLVLGSLAVDFSFPDRAAISICLSVLVKRMEEAGSSATTRSPS